MPNAVSSITASKGEKGLGLAIIFTVLLKPYTIIMYVTKDKFKDIKYPFLHDAMYLIEKWDDTKSVNSIYVDNKGEACIEFDSILSHDSIVRVLAEFYPNPNIFAYKTFEEVIDAVPYENYEYDFDNNKTKIYTYNGFDVRN